MALLRNPIERAFSHYQHEVRDGRESLSFAGGARPRGGAPRRGGGATRSATRATTATTTIDTRTSAEVAISSSCSAGPAGIPAPSCWSSRASGSSGIPPPRARPCTSSWDFAPTVSRSTSRSIRAPTIAGFPPTSGSAWLRTSSRTTASSTGGWAGSSTGHERAGAAGDRLLPPGAPRRWGRAHRPQPHPGHRGARAPGGSGPRGRHGAAPRPGRARGAAWWTSSSPRVLRSIGPLARYLRRERPRALVSSMSHANLVALWAARLAGTGTPVVVTEHNTMSQSALEQGWLERHLWPPVLRSLLSLGQPRGRGLARRGGRLRAHGRASRGSGYEVIYNPVIMPGMKARARRDARSPLVRSRRSRPWCSASADSRGRRTFRPSSEPSPACGGSGPCG